jgi:hypothetical protein
MDLTALQNNALLPFLGSPPPKQSDSRSDRANQIITTVLPAAVQAGLAEIRSAKTVANTATAATQLTGLADTTAVVGTSSAGWLGLASKGVGVLGGVMGAYNLISEWGKSTPVQGAASGAAVGLAVGSVFPGVGTAIGAAVGAAAGGLLGCIRTGKHADQEARDTVRSALVKGGFLDKEYKVTLADGSRYDMGIDGGPKADLGGRRPYEIDFSNPLAAKAVTWLGPVVDLLMGGASEKLKTDFTGYFVNAAVSNAKSQEEVIANVAAMMGSLGITDELLTESVIYGGKAGTISADKAEVYLRGVQERGSVTTQARK